MNDRELLELAAKAAGYDVRWHEKWNCFVHTKPFNICNPPTLAGNREIWSPLSDDGDALRLAIDLQIHLARYDSYSSACALGHSDNEKTEWHSQHVCKYAATRRAIVRAAAEIGKAM